MEILSTGEKIKRARIYQGITLKELCGDKISISKMSCIENGKIKSDEDSLKYISNKLGVDYNYLTQDVYEQIIENLNLLRNNITPYEEREEVVRYNLEYAKENCYYELAFELIHMLFVFYLEENKVENIQLLISDYYDLYQKSNCNVNMITYYEDMATFFRKIKEYNEAINYYSSIRKIFEQEEVSDKEKYVYTCFFEGVCYKELNQVLDSYKCLKKALKYVTYFITDKDKGLFYHEFALVNILLNKVEADKYVMKAYKFQKDDSVSLAKSKGENGKCYFKIFDVDKALIEVEEGIKIFPKENKKEYVEFLINCITTLYENREFDKAFELTDDALNLAIDVDDIRLIEKAYYFKGMIYQKRGLYRESEMYMNLSTDSLLRFASKEQRYKRYNEMAELYYHLGELKQSINYFTLAVNLEKII